MLFSNIAIAALAQSLTASAATMMVTVAANNKFQFTPNSIVAQPGDMVAFNFVSQVRIRFHHFITTPTDTDSILTEPQCRLLRRKQPLPAPGERHLLRLPAHPW